MSLSSDRLWLVPPNPLNKMVQFYGSTSEVPHVPLRESVDIHLIPDPERENMHIRIWWNQMMVHSVDLPLSGFRVHF